MKNPTINYSIDNNLSTTSLKSKKQLEVSISEKKQNQFVSSSLYYPPIKSYNEPLTIMFKGQLVHIVDGGIHANNMQHFLKAMKGSFDIKMHDVLVNSQDRSTKQLKSVEEQLKNLNNRRANYAFEYIAVPILASVPLLNIQDQYNAIMGENKVFTPENIKSNKENLLKFLKEIYNYPNLYSKYIGYMDPIGQGIQYTYGIIQEINKLVKKCAYIYVPSGHPMDLTLKWMAGERGQKPELYHYIATGEDIDDKVARMQKEIKDKNWYNFNLLSLSDAKIVGVKDTDWKKDYIFAAYDSCVTDGARGVYNLSPVRENNQLVGYSFTDKYNNDYPYSEFPLNTEVYTLTRFVGKNKDEVLATEAETKCFLDHDNRYHYVDKLFKVEDVFTESEIAQNKINIQGKYVDRSRKLFFDENKDGKIIFKKCDCEGSGRPSVLSVWGSCYALMNAIVRDDGLNELGPDMHNKYDNYLIAGKSCFRCGNYNGAEYNFSKANEIAKAFMQRSPDYNNLYEASYYLAEIYAKRGKFDEAAGCLNFSIDTLAKNFSSHSKSKSLDSLKTAYDNYHKYKSISENYITARQRYINLPDIVKIFKSMPPQPKEYDKHKSLEYSVNEYNLYVLMMEAMFEKMAVICKKKGENYAARVCDAAARDIKECNSRGNKVIYKRSDKVQYIGDLYNEIKPY